MSNIWLDQQKHFSFARSTTFHVAIFGNEKVGKTAFLEKLKKRLSLDLPHLDQEARVRCYECHQIEDVFEVCTQVYLHMIFFVFDLGNPSTLNDLDYQQLIHLHVPIIFLANKIDLPNRFLSMGAMMSFPEVIPFSVMGEINVCEPFAKLLKTWNGKDVTENKIVGQLCFEQ